MANIQDTADISNFSTETPADEAVVATERPVLSVPGTPPSVAASRPSPACG